MEKEGRNHVKLQKGAPLEMNILHPHLHICPCAIKSGRVQEKAHGVHLARRESPGCLLCVEATAERESGETRANPADFRPTVVTDLCG